MFRVFDVFRIIEISSFSNYRFFDVSMFRCFDVSVKRGVGLYPSKGNGGGLYHCQREEIDDCSRDGEQAAVEAVEQASVPGQEVATILDTQGTLDKALYQVAPRSEYHDDKCQTEPLRQVQGCTYRFCLNLSDHIKAPIAMVSKPPPILPTHDFLGEIRGKSFAGNRLCRREPKQ